MQEMIHEDRREGAKQKASLPLAPAVLIAAKKQLHFLLIWMEYLERLPRYKKESILRTCTTLPVFEFSGNTFEETISEWSDNIIRYQNSISVLYCAVLFLQEEGLLPELPIISGPVNNVPVQPQHHAQKIVNPMVAHYQPKPTQYSGHHKHHRSQSPEQNVHQVAGQSSRSSSKSSRSSHDRHGHSAPHVSEKHGHGQQSHNRQYDSRHRPMSYEEQGPYQHVPITQHENPSYNQTVFVYPQQPQKVVLVGPMIPGSNTFVPIESPTHSPSPPPPQSRSSESQTPYQSKLLDHEAYIMCPYCRQWFLTYYDIVMCPKCNGTVHTNDAQHKPYPFVPGQNQHVVHHEYPQESHQHAPEASHHRSEEGPYRRSDRLPHYMEQQGKAKSSEKSHEAPLPPLLASAFPNSQLPLPNKGGYSYNHNLGSVPYPLPSPSSSSHSMGGHSPHSRGSER